MISCLDKFEDLYIRFVSIKGGSRNLAVRVCTDSIERAVKVANEYRTMCIANNIWGNNKELQNMIG